VSGTVPTSARKASRAEIGEKFSPSRDGRFFRSVSLSVVSVLSVLGLTGPSRILLHPQRSDSSLCSGKISRKLWPLSGQNPSYCQWCQWSVRTANRQTRRPMIFQILGPKHPRAASSFCLPESLQNFAAGDWFFTEDPSKKKRSNLSGQTPPHASRGKKSLSRRSKSF